MAEVVIAVIIPDLRTMMILRGVITTVILKGRTMGTVSGGDTQQKKGKFQGPWE